MILNPEPTWPIVIFEADAWPVIVETPSDLPDLYEDDYWDEVSAAFDADQRPVSVEFRFGRVDASLAPTSANRSFVELARSALNKFDRRGAIRWHAAEVARQHDIDQMSPAELWSEVLRRFRL